VPLDLDVIRAMSPTKGPRCTVARLLDELTEQDRATFLLALNDPDISDAALYRALENDGHTVARLPALGKHRRGQCNCPKEKA
jgi:hypothetical protein